MKQITIYDLLPLLKGGWVAMDADGKWKNRALLCGSYYLKLISWATRVGGIR